MVDNRITDGQLEEIIQAATTEVRRRGMDASDRAVNVALLGAILRLLSRLEERIIDLAPYPSHAKDRRREPKELVLHLVVKVAPAGVGAAVASLIWLIVSLLR